MKYLKIIKYLALALKHLDMYVVIKNMKTLSLNMLDNRCATHPHNIYLEILSEAGILGLIHFY